MRRRTELTYSLKKDATTGFAADSAFERRVGEFDISMRDGNLTATSDTFDGEISEAQHLVSDHLDRWALELRVRHGVRDARFEYEGGSIETERPDGTRDTVVSPASIRLRASVGLAVVSTQSAFPALAGDLGTSPLVEELERRHTAYQDGKEPLRSFIWWLVTRLDGEFGNRKAASSVLSISMQVLDKAAELAATTGGEGARKATGGHKRDLTPEEEAWLRRLPRHVIERAAMRAAGNVSPDVLTRDAV